MERLESNRLHEEALTHLVGGVNSPVRAFKSVHGNPIYFEKASGAIVTDVDGNEYIDLFLGFGTQALHGHNHPQVVNMVREQLGRTVGNGYFHDIELKYTELLKELVQSLLLYFLVVLK